MGFDSKFMWRVSVISVTESVISGSCCVDCVGILWFSGGSLLLLILFKFFGIIPKLSVLHFSFSLFF